SEQSQLWRYHLHYFDYSRSWLVWAASGNELLAYRAFRATAKSWIERNTLLVGDGWHPYTISLRVVNWINAGLAFRSQLQEDPLFSRLFFGSLYAQAQHLASNLEWDVRGNHLLENLRALIIASLAFSGSEPDTWRFKAINILQRELAEQIGAEGGHFERTPG